MTVFHNINLNRFIKALYLHALDFEFINLCLELLLHFLHLVGLNLQLSYFHYRVTLGSTYLELFLIFQSTKLFLDFDEFGSVIDIIIYLNFQKIVLFLGHVIFIG